MSAAVSSQLQGNVTIARAARPVCVAVWNAIETTGVFASFTKMAQPADEHLGNAAGITYPYERPPTPM